VTDGPHAVPLYPARQHAAALFLAVALLVAGCGEARDHPDAPAVDPMIERDSAGVLIIESPSSVLDRRAGWQVGPAPDLILGQGEGDARHQFFRVAGVVGLPGGKIVVADEGSFHFRWFDERGAFLTSVGGRGQGPGEFMRIRLLPGWAPGPLVVHDPTLRRLTWIEPGGEGFQTLSLTSAPLPERVRGPELADSTHGLFLSPPDRCPAEGLCDESGALLWIDLERGTVDTLGVTLRRTFTITDFSVPLLVTVPYDRTPAYAMGPAGPLWAEGKEYEVREYDPEGRLTRILRIASEPRPVSEADLDLQADAWVGGAISRDDARAIIDRMDISPHLPTFSALRVSPAGWIFAEQFRVDSNAPARWLVFDPSGVAHGYLEVPADLTVHYIGDDHLLGVRENEFGVESVVRYPLAEEGGG